MVYCLRGESVFSGKFNLKEDSESFTSPGCIRNLHWREELHAGYLIYSKVDSQVSLEMVPSSPPNNKAPTILMRFIFLYENAYFLMCFCLSSALNKRNANGSLSKNALKVEPIENAPFLEWIGENSGFWKRCWKKASYIVSIGVYRTYALTIGENVLKSMRFYTKAH